MNAKGTAVFLARDWQDSLLPVGPIYDMFDQLTGPKMLHVAPGDHSTGGGAGGVAGLPNSMWDAGIRWLDHYVNGADNGIDRNVAGVWRTEPFTSGGVVSGSPPPWNGTSHPDTD